MTLEFGGVRPGGLKTRDPFKSAGRCDLESFFLLSPTSLSASSIPLSFLLLLLLAPTHTLQQKLPEMQNSSDDDTLAPGNNYPVVTEKTDKPVVAPNGMERSLDLNNLAEGKKARKSPRSRLTGRERARTRAGGLTECLLVAQSEPALERTESRPTPDCLVTR